jgi:hypothetical protein
MRAYNQHCHSPAERSEVQATQLMIGMIHLGGPHSRAMTVAGIGKRA